MVAAHILEAYWKELMRQFGGMCWYCHSKEELHFAHTRETKVSGSGRGKWRRFYDIVNNKDAYILLCASCHETFDKINGTYHVGWNQKDKSWGAH